MFIHLGKPSLIDELSVRQVNPAAIRGRYRILAIDDQGFPMREVLGTHGFTITEMEDIKAIDITLPFQIVICDVRGVGRHFGGRHEGAHLLKEIRKLYPDKYIVSSTAFKSDPSYNEYFRAADASVQKDANSEIWVHMLDKAISIMADPKARWLRMRRHLLDEVGVGLWEVLLIEQALVESLRKNERRELDSAISALGTSSDAKTLLEAFAKSLFTDVAASAVVAAIT